MPSTPLALSILGMDSGVEQQRQQVLASDGEDIGAPISRLIELRSANRSPCRRVTSYHNSFQTVCNVSNDAPPAYQSKQVQGPAVTRIDQDGSQELPNYDCTVNAEATMLMLTESVNPVHDIGVGYWKEVYAEIRGTMLTLYRLKDKRPARILRSYTLQHAEIGLATDCEHTVLIPQTRLAHLVPPMAREKAWRRDNKMYNAQRQHIIRLRVETDQFMLANSSETHTLEFLEALSAAIDISHPIDERSQAKQCTMPRRRRRARPQPETNQDLTDPAFLAEQERIMRQHFPGLMESSTIPAIDVTPAPTVAEQAEPVPTRPAAERSQSQAGPRDEEELDLSLLAEDSNSLERTRSEQLPNETRPSASRMTTATTIEIAPTRDVVENPSNFDAEGKWAPPHNRSATQAQRYIRRCLPVLTSDAIRASDVLIKDGKRVKINWRMLSLEAWELSPPSYASHIKASPVTPLERTASQSSSTAASTDQNSQRETTDEIMPLETPSLEVTQQGAELFKTVSNFEESGNKPVPAAPAVHLPLPLEESKSTETRSADTAVHGVIFSF